MNPLQVLGFKPLNPLALSYEPLHPSHNQFTSQSPQFYVASLPPFLHAEPVSYPDPSFVSCNPWSLYNLKMQPRPGFNVPCSVPNDGRKKKSRPLLPPRLRQPRDNHMVWVEKDAEKIKASSDVNADDVPLLSTVTAEEQKKFDGKTSLMIRNVPNHFKRHHLQRLLDHHCRDENMKAQTGSDFCKSAYDFLYLPMDFMFGLNLGYAFVNFTTNVAALRFYRAFNRLEWSCGNNRKKICEIGVAKHQGKNILEQNFQHSYFLCHSNEYLPVVFSPARDGSNRSRPSIVGRRIHVTATRNAEKTMIMKKRKMNKKSLNF
ncbi:hypothetical protein V6N12_067044 [Hibiscus sabdariffa]|uniref:Mei2-like C-terminal RNA recognition motif domain-containing protein n=1 Tax=Hibiscus sabdariffa TaxID=183260 RepID=A0ABR2BLB6_9ROSI